MKKQLRIAISNNKGGCGKTSTAMQLGTYLAYINIKTLLIDFDPQGNLSFSFGVKNHVNNVYDMIKNGYMSFLEVRPNLSLVAANNLLGNLQNEFSNTLGKELMLRSLLDEYAEEFDVIIIDCPATFSLLTDLAYVSVDKIVIPINTDLYSIDGMAELKNRSMLIKKLYNPNLEIDGILITKSQTGTNASKRTQERAKLCSDILDAKVFKSVIRNSVTVTDAQDNFMSLLEYAPKAEITKDYVDFLKEIVGEYNERYKN